MAARSAITGSDADDSHALVPGHGGTNPTPITDLIRDLLSQGLSWDMALKAATTVELNVSSSTRYSASDEKRRLHERQRKAEWRKRNTAGVPGHVPGQSQPHIYLTKDSPTSQKEKEVKKGVSAVPVVPGQSDDWPDNFGDQFWDAYPPGRKQDKAKVFVKLGKFRVEGYLDAYKKRQRLTWAALMDGLGRFVATQPDPQFTPAPIVWLNGHRWDSDYGDRISKASGAEDGKARYGGQQGLGFAGIAALARRSASGKI